MANTGLSILLPATPRLLFMTWRRKSLFKSEQTFWIFICHKQDGHIDPRIRFDSPVKTAAAANREADVTEQTYCRWRKEYGGLKVDQAKLSESSPKIAANVTFADTLRDSIAVDLAATS
ncbi:MAG: hypothetical protein WCF30_01300 [Terracidiphilus sp.]